ncbi:hypothetical protein FKP32DRAFT_1675540, partial [Trametes sanguinea]
PTCLAALVPRLLQLLAHLEAIRTDTAAKIRTVLELDAQATDGAARAGPSLSKEDREVLEALARPSRLLAQRTIFRKIIHGCCMLVSPPFRPSAPAPSSPLLSPPAQTNHRASST